MVITNRLGDHRRYVVALGEINIIVSRGKWTEELRGN